MTVIHSTMQSTSVRHYSLWSMACEAVHQAEAARNKAYHTADKEPTRENFDRFVETDKAYKQAVEAREQVRLMKKYFPGKRTQ